MKKFFTFIAAALMCVSTYADPEVKSVVLDFTDDAWGIPTDYVTTEASYTNGDYTITFGASSNGHKAMTKSKTDATKTGVIFGKKDATIVLPTLDFAVSKIVVTGISGASGKVTTNIFVGDEAVSTELTGATGVNTFIIQTEKRTAGNVFVLKVTNANNAQAAKIEMFEDQGEAMPTVDTVSVSQARTLIDANDSNPHYVRGVAAGSPFLIGSAEFKGNIVLWMTDETNAADSLEAYYIAGKDNKAWESLAAAKDEIQAGDTILVYATKLKKYNKTYEIDPGYYVEMLGKLQEDPSEFETLTVAQAIEAAEALADNATSEKKVFVEGFTNHVQNYDVENGNQTFFMFDEGVEGQDSVFQAFRATPKKDSKAYPVLEGDKVRALGFLKKYIDTKNGNAKTLEIVEPTIEFLSEVPGDRTIKVPSLDTITVAQALEIGQDLDSAGVTDIQYVVWGYVSSIEAAYDETNKNETFWIYGEKDVCAASNAAGAFEVYRGKPNTEKEIGRNAKVYVTCKIQKYGKNKVIETAGTPAVNVVEEGVPDVPEVKTVAEILTLGAGLTEASCERYEITGYVSAIKELYSDVNKYETFWITDTKGARTNDPTKAFQVYRGKPNTGKEIGLDAQIKIVTKITNYSGTIENPVANTTFEVLEQGEWKVDTITVAEAITKTGALEAGGTSVEAYAVKGFIAHITTAYDSKNKNATFQISDDRFATSSNFSCYRAAIATADVDKLAEGAYVLVTGFLNNHSKGMQLAQGATVEFLVAPKIDTLTVTVAQAIEAGLALEVDAMSNAIYVVTGVALDADPDTWDEGVQSEEFTLGDNADAADGLAVYYAQVSAPISAGCTVEVTGRLKKVSDTEVQLPNGQARIVSYPEAIENVVLTEKAQKVVVDGVIYIIRDNKMFDIRGAQVR